jgi:hypothetical protein
MRIFKSLISACILLAVFCLVTQACSCGVTSLSARDDAARVFKDATVVFEGEILSTEPAKQADLSQFSAEAREMITKRDPVSAEITFRVLRQYKGDPKLEIRMYTGARDSAEPCQARYHSGDRWFIYGFLKKDGKIYFTDCNRSTPLHEAGAEMRYARGEPATDEDLMPREEQQRLDNDPELKENGATLSGTIRRFDRGPISKASLNIWRLDEENQKDRPGLTFQDANPDGTFVVRYLPPAIYFLSADVIDWEKPAHFVGRTETFVVKERQSLTGLEIVLDPETLGEVRVRIEPSDALRGPVNVELWDADDDWNADNPKLYPDRRDADADSSGLATLRGLQYATYHVAVSSPVGDETGVSVQTACHQTDDTTTVKLDKPIVEITVHLQCKGK